MANPHQFGKITETLQAFEDTRISLSAFTTLLDKSIYEGGGDLRKDSYGITLLLKRQIEDLEHIEDSLREATADLHKQVMEDDRIRTLLSSVGIKDIGTDIIRSHLIQYFKTDTGDRIAEIASYLDVDRGIVELVLSCAINPDWVKEKQKYWKSAAAEVEPKPIANVSELLLSHIGSNDLRRVATKLGLDENTVYNVIVTLAVPDSSAEAEHETHQIEQPKPADLRKEFIADKLKEGVDAGQIAQALNLKRATVERVIGQLLAVQPNSDPENGQQAVNG